jgi:hypothetical protein
MQFCITTSLFVFTEILNRFVPGMKQHCHVNIANNGVILALFNYYYIGLKAK